MPDQRGCKGAQGSEVIAECCSSGPRYGFSDFGSLPACYLIIFLTGAISLELCYLGVVHYVTDLLMYIKVYHLNESFRYSLFSLRIDAAVVYHLGSILGSYNCICVVHILNILLLV